MTRCILRFFFVALGVFSSPFAFFAGREVGSEVADDDRGRFFASFGFSVATSTAVVGTNEMRGFFTISQLRPILSGKAMCRSAVSVTYTHVWQEHVQGVKSSKKRIRNTPERTAGPSTRRTNAGFAPA